MSDNQLHITGGNTISNAIISSPFFVNVPYAAGSLASSLTGVGIVNNTVSALQVQITTTDTALEVIGTVTVQNTTINDGVTISLYRTTLATLPTAGTTQTGDTKVWATTTTHGVAAQNVSVGFDFIDTGLLANTQYGYYVCIVGVTGGTASLMGGFNQSTIMLQNI